MADASHASTEIRILHLEDDPADGELIRLQLEADVRPAEVVRVDNQAAFEAALRSGHFDLVLSDYSLPGFDGPAALALSQQLNPDLPIIIVTGALDEETAVRLVRGGATDYVLKSRLRRLAPAIHQALREARERQARRAAERLLSQQVERMAVLAEAAQAFGEAGPDYRSVVNAVARRAAELLGDSCTLRLLSDDDQWLSVAAEWHRNPATLALLRSLTAQPMPADTESITTLVLRSGHSQLIPSVTEPDLPRLIAESWRPYWVKAKAHSLVAVPLRTRGRVIGVLLATRDETPQPYTDDDRHLLRGLADRAALVIENARLYEAAQSAWGAAEVAAERAERLHKVTALMAAALTPDEVGRIIVNEGASVLGTSAATLQLLSANGEALHVVNVSRLHALAQAQRRIIPMNEVMPSVEVMRTGHAVWFASQAEVAQRFPRMVSMRLMAGYEALAVLPMTIESRPIGTLAINFPQARTFTLEEQSFMLTLAGLCAQALERARLYAAEAAARANAEQAVERTARLQAVTAALASALSPAEVATVIVTESMAAMGAHGGSVSVITPDGEGLDRLQSEGYGESIRPYTRIPLSTAAPTADAVRTGAPLWLESRVDFVARYPQWEAMSQALGFEATAVVPLLVDNQAVGALALTFLAPRKFALEDQDFLLAVGRQCALALERARLFEAERQSRHAAEQAAMRTARLQMVAAALAQALTPEQVAAIVVEHGVAALGAMAGSIALLARDRAAIEVVQSVGYVASTPYPGGTMALEASFPVAEAVRTGEAVWVESAEALAARYPALADLYAQWGHGASVAVPIAVGGQTAGALELGFAGPRHFGVEEQALVLALTQQCAQALERTRLYAEAQALNAALERRVRERTEQLRAITARLESLREDERARIAREVHDELGGSMTAIKMDLSRLARRAGPASGTSPEALAGTIQLIDDTLQTVRRIATDLRPALLDDFGLVAAIEWQAQEFARRTGLECELDFEVQEVELEKSVATALFRVFQETLTNIARHAEATRVTVRLARQPGDLVLTLSDNGQGFQVADLARSPSLGVAGMRERVFSIAGTLDIQSVPGAGTTVVVTVPLPETARSSNRGG